MARKRRNKSKTELDWTAADEGGGGGFRIPEGEYRMRFKAVERDESKEGNDMLVWDFTGLEGKAKKKDFRVWTSLLPEALWKLANLLDAMGIDRPDTVEDIIEVVEAEDPAPEIIGVVTDDEYQNKTRSKLTDFSSVDGGGKDGDGDDAPDFDEMDEDELAKFVKKNKLDVDLDDFKTLKKKRAAVAEAHEAESGDGDGEGGDDLREQIGEMDEDDLTKLLKKHKIKDVDLDEHRTIKKKRAAVIEALEEAEVLEAEGEEGGDEGNKRRGGKGGKGGKAKIAKSEVNEMDEDELADCNKKNKLKVDLDEFRTIKKKRAAIAEALEENDLLEDDE